MMKPDKEYRCIVKVGNDKFLRYHVNNLLKFTAFLDREWPEWRWFNVYGKKEREQVASFTKNNRPLKSTV